MFDTITSDQLNYDLEQPIYNFFVNIKMTFGSLIPETKH